MTYYSSPGIMQPCSSEKIIETVSKFYGIPVEKIKSKSRIGLTPMVRQIACWLIEKKIHGLTLTQISEFFGSAYKRRDGKFDHTAIIHNLKIVNGWVEVGDSVVLDINNIMRNLLIFNGKKIV